MAEKYRVMRQDHPGAKKGVAANGLSKKEADEYVEAMQASNDPRAFTVEKD